MLSVRFQSGADLQAYPGLLQLTKQPPDAQTPSPVATLPARLLLGPRTAGAVGQAQHWKEKDSHRLVLQVTQGFRHGKAQGSSVGKLATCHASAILLFYAQLEHSLTSPSQGIH